MWKVTYNGRVWVLAELCREVGIDRRTVVSRLNKGMAIEEAISQPPRSYPRATRKRQPVEAQELEAAPRPKLIEDAIDLMLDMRAVLEDIESTPRRARILSGVRQWLRAAGWR